jgi:CRISPR-associated protein Csb3
MTIIRLGGSAASALTHMAMVGLVAILHDRAGVDPRMCWIESDGLTAQVDVPDLSSHEIGAVVGEHAAKCSKPDSWVSEDLDHEGRLTAVFSPRIKGASTDQQWARLQKERHEGMDRIRDHGGDLDLRFIHALGEPAYWRSAANGPRPDEGASRWDMKTRNRGEEFVGNRLRLLAAAVGARDNDLILQGLTGAAVCDECGKDARDSRSSTGLTRPGPTDNALAWCALWGIAQFPVIQRVDQRSATAGYLPAAREPRRGPAMVIPMPIRPMLLARFRSLVRSPELVDGGRNGLESDGSAAEISAAALEWFKVRGVGALMRFPIERVGSSSAPENRLLDGVMIRTAARPM